MFSHLWIFLLFITHCRDTFDLFFLFGILDFLFYPHRPHLVSDRVFKANLEITELYSEEKHWCRNHQSWVLVSSLWLISSTHWTDHFPYLSFSICKSAKCGCWNQWLYILLFNTLETFHKWNLSSSTHYIKQKE